MQSTFLNCYYWLAEIFNSVYEKQDLPFREVKMVSSRFSGKTHNVELLLNLLMIQQRNKVVINYIRSRGEEVFKTMRNMEYTIMSMVNEGIEVKSNIREKLINVGNNKLNFHILNETKVKAEKDGGKIGLSIEYDADYIITFYEECSQLDLDLVENHRHSVRGNLNTKTMFIYASNPWVKTHWLMKDFAAKLPETSISQQELEERGYNKYYDSETNTLYFRPRYTLNRHVKQDQIKEVELLKTINYNKWKVVSLGFSGNSSGALYDLSLQSLNQETNNKMSPCYFHGGIDWGDGKSKQGSPTTAYFGLISLEEGVHILDEYEYWNNKGESIDTNEQLSRLCDFFIKWYTIYQSPITVYIDNAALGDFFKLIQSVLRSKGYNESQIEFLPAGKNINTWERVESVNVMLSLGILRFNKDVCPKLYEALYSCYEVVKTSPTEEMKRQRSHEWTHWIHAMEYMIGPWFKEFQAQFPVLMETKRHWLVT